MEIFRKNIKQLGFYTYLTFLSFILLGCSSEESVPMAASTPTPVYDIPVGAEETESETDKPAEGTWKPLYEFTEENLIRWEQVKELETEDYYIELQENDIGEYPQIVLKEGKSIFCGTEHINSLLRAGLRRRDYNILYADQYYISLWYGDKETGKTEGTYVINLQCPVTESFVNMVDSLIGIQDDNDYRYAPWPSNGIILSFDKILEEIEKGNCYLDETGYALWQESPDVFIASVCRQFEEIEAGGYEEAYWARENNDDSKKAYRMYIRQGRVGFYIHPIDVWEASEGTEFYHFSKESIKTDRDFRVEVAYDWQKEAPVYHMPYEVYGERFESKTYGTFYYPQIKGLDENIISALNTAMKHDLNENLVYMDLKEWNEKMKPYVPYGEEEWEKLPPVNNPMVTYQTEKYLCIRQEFITSNEDAVRFAEDWKRYHVYDLETGRSLQLKDIICLDEEFVMWLKEEKKVEARRGFPGWAEGMKSINQTVEWMEEDLEYYPAETLSAVLEDAEFWLKEDSLYIRIPYYDQIRDEIQYTGGGNGNPNYLDHAEVRIALKDIQRFLKVEPWGMQEPIGER